MHPPPDRTGCARRPDAIPVGATISRSSPPPSSRPQGRACPERSRMGPLVSPHVSPRGTPCASARTNEVPPLRFAPIGMTNYRRPDPRGGTSLCQQPDLRMFTRSKSTNLCTLERGLKTVAPLGVIRRSSLPHCRVLGEADGEILRVARQLNDASGSGASSCVVRAMQREILRCGSE
jgi:hypothetical protein